LAFPALVGPAALVSSLPHPIWGDLGQVALRW